MSSAFKWSRSSYKDVMQNLEFLRVLTLAGNSRLPEISPKAAHATNRIIRAKFRPLSISSFLKKNIEEIEKFNGA